MRHWNDVISHLRQGKLKSSPLKIKNLQRSILNTLQLLLAESTSLLLLQLALILKFEEENWGTKLSSRENSVYQCSVLLRQKNLFTMKSGGLQVCVKKGYQHGWSQCCASIYISSNKTKHLACLYVRCKFGCKAGKVQVLKFQLKVWHICPPVYVHAYSEFSSVL